MLFPALLRWLPGRFCPTVKRRSCDSKDPAQPLVQKARDDARIHLTEGIGSGDNGRKFGIVAMVEELVELFLHPGCYRLGANIIQHQQRGSTDLLKTPVICDGTVWAEGGAQMIEQIGQHNK